MKAFQPVLNRPNSHCPPWPVCRPLPLHMTREPSLLTFLSRLAGLTSDDQNLHSDRIKLWNDFNHAWLATFQAQKELMDSGRPLGRGQTLITLDGLKKLGDELVRLCDSIERHGLVDYQYGVWEEQITESTLSTPLIVEDSPTR